MGDKKTKKLNIKKKSYQNTNDNFDDPNIRTATTEFIALSRLTYARRRRVQTS